MIEYRRSSLLDDRLDAIVNPVNCLGVSGSGVALALKLRYPKMYSGYRAACERGEVRPGRSYVHIGVPTIICAPTKDDWRDPSTLELVEAALDDIVHHADRLALTTVGIPALGCGRGGLQWDDVRPLTERVIRDSADDGLARGTTFCLYQPR